ncbi:MAG: hypothetical protein AB7P14_10055 [Blastocatellales bacterium]
MGNINVARWIAGGVAAGVLIWLIEGTASVFYMGDMEKAMAEHNLKMEVSAGAFAITIIVSLVSGLALVFFYAASRPRFGPGPKTATIIAVAFWLGAVFVSLMGYKMLGLFQGQMLAVWGLIGLVEMILASILGAWIYRES